MPKISDIITLEVVSNAFGLIIPCRFNADMN